MLDYASYSKWKVTRVGPSLGDKIENPLSIRIQESNHWVRQRSNLSISLSTLKVGAHLGFAKRHRFLVSFYAFRAW